MGAYAEYAVVPAERLVRIPDGLDARSAAAALLQGMTAHYLAASTYPLKEGDTALVHAAAGGVGSLLIQIAKMRGARVFGTVSTQEKAQLARAAGADAVILYTTRTSRRK
jgi:NADPH2:quinone reductase